MAGEDAAAKGLQVFDGNEDAATIYVLLNIRGDDIAHVIDMINAIPTPTPVTWDTLTGKPPTFPPSAHSHSYPQIGAGAINNGGFGLTVGQASITGSLFNPSANTPVASSWVALAMQTGDGRYGIQPSARRFKKNIGTHVYTDEQLDAFLDFLDRTYQLRASIEGTADGPWNLGWIAEEVVDAGFADLVVFDGDGQPLSINYSQAVVPLHAAARRERDARLTLEQRVIDLEERLARLDGGV